jgi:hypothetical protein
MSESTFYIQPCVSEPDDTEHAEPGDELVGLALPCDAHFWSVYKRGGDGMSIHVFDVPTYDEALLWARKWSGQDSVSIRLPEYTGGSSARFVSSEGFTP